MANTTYYRYILTENKTRMAQLHHSWEKISQCIATPEHGKCAIQTVLGQTQLLISKKFDAMNKLLNEADEQKDLKVNNQDLQELWDGICIEVEDLNEKYKGLETRVRNGWSISTDPKKQTSTKPEEKTPVTTEMDLVPRGIPKYSFPGSLPNRTPFSTPKGSFAISLPTATPSTSSSRSSVKVYSAPGPSMIRSKADAKNSLNDLVETPIQFISDTDDSDEEYFDALSS